MDVSDVIVGAGAGLPDVIGSAARAICLLPAGDAAAAGDKRLFRTRITRRQRPRSRHRAQGNPFRKLRVERQLYYLIDVPHRNPSDPLK